MKSLILICIKEFKCSRLMYLLSIALLSSIFSVGFFVLIASSNIIEGFYDHTNSLAASEGGFVIELAGLQYSSIDMVSDFNFESVYPEFTGGIDSNDFSYNGTELSDFLFDVVYFEEDTDIKTVSGIDVSSEYNDSYYAWITEETAERLGCNTGDKIYNGSSAYEIVGIVQNTSTIFDITIPFGAYYSSKTDRGEYVVHQIYAVVSDARDVMTAYSQLKKMGIMPFNEMDDLFEFLELMNVFLRVIFLLTLAAGLWAFSNVCSIILNNRFKFIIRMRVLGMSARFISLVYVVLMTVMMICSFLVVSVLGSFFLNHVGDVMGKIYSNAAIQDSSEVILQIAITGVVLCAVLIVKTFIDIGRRVEKSDLIGILEEKV